MNFKKHSNLEGCHAFLGASKYHWIRYSDQKIIDSYRKFMAVQKGTQLHEYASMSINLGQKLPSRPATTLSMFVNDAIGYKMNSEQILYYSPNCFGTADAISFNKKLLRIHDLKTGELPTHMEQLQIYAALFCLEYGIKPGEIDYELRIYQNNEIWQDNPTADVILPIMDRIITADKILNKLKEEK